MNYPVWELTGLGGSLLIAIIAVVHVYVAQFAVGGGFFLWLTDRRAERTGDKELLNYVKGHTRFFLLLTMVFGGVTGVGIWFVISLVHPSGTSALIHNFVFAWAIEWVFFVVEIVALLIYSTYFDRMDVRLRQRVAAIYAAAAWLSLFVINGILTFMLTPGRWLETGNFWDGFFNPTHLPGLVYRTFLALTLAGIFAYITAVAARDPDLRARLMRRASAWLLLPMLGVAAGAAWYYHALPEEVRLGLFTRNPETRHFLPLFWGGGLAVIALGVLFMARLPRPLQKVLVGLLLIIGLAWTGGFEYLREIARKPYVIHGYMYSNSVLKKDLARINREGVLKTARFASHRKVTPATERAVGRDLFAMQCLPCHTVGGYNDVKKRTASLTEEGLEALLAGIGKLHGYMPPFAGDAAERRALAHYIGRVVHGRPPVPAPPAPAKPMAAEPPAKQPPGEYVLLAWSKPGMRCVSDTWPWFGIMTPGTTMQAQLFKRGDTPEVVTEDVTLEYAVEAGHEHPSRHSEFWKYSQQYMGVKIPDDKGLTGLGLKGKFSPDKKGNGFAAAMIPVMPHRDDGSENPYPLLSVTARDAESGQVLAATKVVAPTSTELGCGSCHGGGAGAKGAKEATAVSILKLHDRDNGTRLLADARAGKPRFCQTCHADPSMKMKGEPGRLSFSAAMHGWHANHMAHQGAAACGSCHPSGEAGKTRCLRGVHAGRGLTCVRCHGSLQEHAAALLKGEQKKASAARLLEHLEVSQVKSLAEVKARKPWRQQPDCLTCHVDYQKPAAGVSGFNRWVSGPDKLYRARFGEEEGIRCAACHGPPHALYPAKNPAQQHRDNLQPLQYSGLSYPIGSERSCTVCHTEMPEDELHHANMLRAFRGK